MADFAEVVNEVLSEYYDTQRIVQENEEAFSYAQTANAADLPKYSKKISSISRAQIIMCTFIHQQMTIRYT
jgi:hypothetical protein